MSAPRDLEAEFNGSIRGQARAAKASGQKYFQVMLSINSPYQVWSDKIWVDQNRTKDFGDQGAVLSDIAEEGWTLLNFTVTFIQLGAVTKSKIIGFGENTSVRGGVYGVYIFEATDKIARVDRLWDRFG